jgi:ferritin-like metal-binding protein YciE
LQEAVGLLDATLQEEKNTDATLTKIAETSSIGKLNESVAAHRAQTLHGDLATTWRAGAAGTTGN